MSNQFLLVTTTEAAGLEAIAIDAIVRITPVGGELHIVLDAAGAVHRTVTGVSLPELLKQSSLMAFWGYQ